MKFKTEWRSQSIKFGSIFYFLSNLNWIQIIWKLSAAIHFDSKFVCKIVLNHMKRDQNLVNLRFWLDIQKKKNDCLNLHKYTQSICHIGLKSIILKQTNKVELFSWPERGYTISNN